MLQNPILVNFFLPAGVLRARQTRTLRKYQEQREAEQSRLERPFIRELAGLFRRQRDLLLAEMKSFNAARIEAVRKVTQADQDPIVLAMQKILRRTRPTMERIFQARLSAAVANSRTINHGLIKVNATVDFTLYNKIVVEFLGTHIPQLSGVVENETLRRVSRMAARAIKEGQSMQELAVGLKKMFKGMSTSRAQMIAQTEVGMAQSVGDFTAAERVDLELVKIWSNSRDDKVRPSHQIRELREMTDRFSNGLLYPLEPGAPAEEVIRCRCTVLYVPRDEAKAWL